RLDYYDLQKRFEASTSPAPVEKSSLPSFVELVPAPCRANGTTSAPVPECLVELESPGGAKLRIHWKGTAAPDLAALGRLFWRCQKRLSRGRFRFWPESTSGVGQRLEAHELQVLLAAGNPAGAQAPATWRRVSPGL